jgi:hypothetical protein
MAHRRRPQLRHSAGHPGRVDDPGVCGRRAAREPGLNLFRSDVSGLFPGLANSGGPVAYRVLDTTALAEGQHDRVGGSGQCGGRRPGSFSAAGSTPSPSSDTRFPRSSSAQPPTANRAAHLRAIRRRIQGAERRLHRDTGLPHSHARGCETSVKGRKESQRSKLTLAHGPESFDASDVVGRS